LSCKEKVVKNSEVDPDDALFLEQEKEFLELF